MAEKFNIPSGDDLLKDAFGNFEPQAPEGLWEQLAGQLPEVNNALRAEGNDDFLREGFDKLDIQAPQGVWHAIEQALPGAAQGGWFAGIKAWVAGVAVVSIAATAIIWNTRQEKTTAPFAPVTTSENTIAATPGTTGHSTTANSAGETITAPTPVAAETVTDHVSSTGNEKNATRPQQSIQDKGAGVRSPFPYQENSGNTPSAFFQQSTLSSPGFFQPEGNKVPGTPLPEAPYTMPASLFGLEIQDTVLCKGRHALIRVFAADTGKKYYLQLAAESAWIPVKHLQEIPLKAEKTTTVKLKAVANENVMVIAKTLTVLPSVSPSFVVQEAGEGVFRFDITAENDNYFYLLTDGKKYTASKTVEVTYFDYEKTAHAAVLIEKNTYGCLDSFKQTIVNTSVVEKQVPTYYNIFTPDGDGINDYFEFPISGEISYSMTIFDKDSRKVFESNNKNTRWNGNYMNLGNICPEGTYYYVFRYQFKGEDKREVTGTIKITR